MMMTTRTGSLTALAAMALLALYGCGVPEADGADAGRWRAGTDAPAQHSHHHAAHDHGTAAHGGAHEDAHDDAHGDAMAADEPADFSIYHAGSVWTDQHGERRPIADLAGRVQVVGMVYTSCAYACPRMVLDMKRLEDELGRRGDVGFVLVSIDPERDTPARLAEFARGARLDPARWTLLHGDEGDILELAALLGVQYRRMANDEFIHSNLLTVLDRAGQVVHRQMGLGADPAPTLDVIRSLDR
jgi:protein SCO1